MKLRSLALITFILCGLLVPKTANASTQGCPNTWVIDTSSEQGITEILNAKQLLGFNLSIQAKTSFTNYSGEIGSLNRPTYDSFGISDLYLYGNTQVQLKYEVQLKGCPGMSEFVFTRGKLRDAFNLTDNTYFINSTPQEWANSHSDAFTDFISAQGFTNCFNALEKRISMVTQIPYDGISRELIRTGPFGTCGARRDKGGNVTIVNMTPDCAWRNGDRAIGILVPSGKICKYAFALFDGTFPGAVSIVSSGVSSIVQAETVIQPPIVIAKVNGPITLFPAFFVSNKKITTINCVKGKLEKKVNGVDPKCPAGFKQK